MVQGPVTTPAEVATGGRRVAVLAYSATVDRLVEAIKPFYPTVIQTSLTRDHEEELVRALLGGGDRVDVVVGGC
jgi:uncharacterized membrane protein